MFHERNLGQACDSALLNHQFRTLRHDVQLIFAQVLAEKSNRDSLYLRSGITPGITRAHIQDS
jgi:hypothetical protein